MAIRPTLTLGICLAAGLAAGIGLARPGTTSAGTDPAVAAVADAPATAQPATGYGATPAPAPTPDPANAQGTGEATPAPSPAPNPAPAAAPASAAIQISGFAFGQPITVAPGAAIEVANQDGAAHTLTSVDGAFDTGNLGGGQQTGLTAPTEPGSYAFFCVIHPSMQGSLTVAA